MVSKRDSDEDYYEEDGHHEAICERCGDPDYIEDMIDCPRYQDTIERVSIPGWLCLDCCKDEFKLNPEDCIDSCYEEAFSKFFQDVMTEIIDLSELEKKEYREVEAYFSKDGTYAISLEMDKYVESFRPLNIIVDTFNDEKENILYVKDNNRNIQKYILNNYDEVLSRLSTLENSYIGHELYCIKDGPLFITYNITDYSIGGMIAPISVGDEIDVINILKKLKEDYYEGESFFDIILEPDTEKLREIIQGLNEDNFIRVVLCPLFRKMKYQNVVPVSFHGPGESGADIYPFYKSNEFGKIVYYGAQAKAEKIHADASRKKGNVETLITQVKKLLRNSFKSFIDNTEKKIGHAFILNSHEFTPDAKNELFREFESRTNISIVEIDDILTAVIEYQLTEEILNYQRRTVQSEISTTN